MEIRKIQIEDIRESEFNPRVRLEKGSPEYEQIEASIREIAGAKGYGCCRSGVRHDKRAGRGQGKGSLPGPE